MLGEEKHQFGDYGGGYVPETLTRALTELEEGFAKVGSDSEFRKRLNMLLQTYVGRPTPLYYAANLSQQLGLKLYLKREDLTHTGAHKINNALGQALLAKKLGKQRIIAETGAGQHGVAAATACALLGLPCAVYMGTEDMKRQELNVKRMRLLGAEVRGVTNGTKTLKDAVSEAIRDWIASFETSHYLIGSVIGPHPYPRIVAELQAVIGCEAKDQFAKQVGDMPGTVVACVGGGSNAAGVFRAFVDDPEVELIGVEAAGKDGVGAASLNKGRVGVLHGTKTYVLQNDDGQISTTNSISAGLDYPAVGPEHAGWKDSGRVRYEAVRDDDALDAFHLLCRTEGIVGALEATHALAHIVKNAKNLNGTKPVLMLLSGRGDKDLATVIARQK